MTNVDEWKAMLSHSLNPADLSRDADLAIGVMNLISIEEHASFSLTKTGDSKYTQILAVVRPMRRDFLQRLVGEPPAEQWCISKHLLAASMRLFESGTKELDAGRTQQAKEFFDAGYELYALFFGLKTGALDLSEKVAPAQKQADEKKEVGANQKTGETGRGFSDRIRALVTEIVNCCRE